jgi:hypothetical protein
VVRGADRGLRGRRRWEAVRLLRGAGYPAVTALAMAGALVVAADVASIEQLRPYADLLVAAS